MTKQPFHTLEVPTRAAWRRWLRAHHAKATAIWVVFRKGAARGSSLTYDAAVEEALAVGWIDSLVKRIDDERYARKFTPRRPDSQWSASNRRRYEKLRAQGLLTAAGLNRPPTARSAAPPALPSYTRLPPEIERAIRANARAWANFERLPPSSRRYYVGWVDLAKRPETRARRLREVVSVLAAGKKLGPK